jgi:5'-nucleotidase
VHILLTNDDGIHAPGLAALQPALASLGDLSVVAPSSQCSGVSHGVTYLQPLTCEEVPRAGTVASWSVDGMPADCVKLGINRLLETRPELVVSGINGGLNAGINVIYSGTVAAAREAALLGVTSLAISLEAAPQPDYDRAATIALGIIKQILAQRSQGGFYNVNIPTRALDGTPQVAVAAMSLELYGEYLQREDPKGRPYYWSSDSPPPPPTSPASDVDLLEQGLVTITPLQLDSTDQSLLSEMRSWPLGLPDG